MPYASQAADEEIIIRIDGRALDLKGNTPFITNGTTFIPLRLISESLGYKVDWDGETKL
ncbi:MAG: copper amine oxidase N-terminal domain-containing protein [Tissierellia bacterium]|nr:copper amine oxidase N-terminal domain-containing protein [Tissierellia bacterium]